MSVARTSNTVQHLPLPGVPLVRQKATDQWIAVQNNRLPDCVWYHLVFTLPDTLWPLFFGEPREFGKNHTLRFSELS